MSISADHTPRHPVASLVARMHDQLDHIVERPIWSMGDDETRHTLLEATRLLARLSALELKVAAHADRNQVGDASGATSASAWWANNTRMTQREAARKMKLAKTLEQHEPVGEALAAGDVLADQARVVTDAVEALPDTVQPGVRDQARDHLLGAARHYDARALRIQGRRILDVVAPEIGEAEEAKQLAAEERKAERSARLTMHDDGHGQTHGRFTLPTADADMLRKPLMALASPKAGGVAATVVVTMTLETLLGGLKAAHLDTGTRISPGLARKLACEAGVIPVVLGGKSEVLDVGRRHRLHTKAQRIAMAVRDQGCAADGCERPTSACHAHHLVPWAHGGGTSVKDGVLLCPRHHTLAHHDDYDLTHHPGGKITFTRRE